jgi:endonuclease YncB( thermonuclease family)
MMIWTGLLLGLLVFQALRLWSLGQVQPRLAHVAASVAHADPYGEAERSREILGAQEGPPPPVSIPRGSPLDAANGPLEAAPTLVRGDSVGVIDGDTFVYRDIHIRIADIDTPEVHGRCAAETALAARATQRMRALLAAGPFELHPTGDGRDEDRYRRKLRIVTRNGRSLGDMLVAEGLARTWTGRREPWC